MSLKHNLVQISDTHLFSNKNARLKESNTYLNLKITLETISKLEEKPDLILLTGDLSQDCTLESYKHLKELLEPLKIKYYLLPGNHDDVRIMNDVFQCNWVKDQADYSFEYNGWFFYFIDTTVFPDNWGELSNKQLADFDKVIALKKDIPTIVFMHHHPVSVRSKWIDEMALKNADAFNKGIRKNPQIKAVLFGHVHQAFEEIIDSVFYASAPATSYQVVPNVDKFTVEKLVPGFRFISLQDNKFSSKVVWV